MKKNLTIFGVNKRIELLNEFRNLVVDYFNSLEHDPFGFDRETKETNEGQQTRSQINLRASEARKYIIESGVFQIINWSPPPAVGGYQQRVDIIQNIFLLEKLRIPPQSVTDMIDQAVGAFESEKKEATIRTYNPFFWVGLFLSKISSIPFKILEHAGLYGKKFEDSIVGRILKLISSVIIVLVALYGFLELIGREDLLLRYFEETQSTANKTVEVTP